MRERWRAFTSGITGTIVLIVAALTVPLIFLPIAAIQSISDANLAAQRTALLYTARAIAAGVDAELDTYLALSNALRASQMLLADDLAPFDSQARRVAAQFPDAWIVVSDLAGQQLVNTALAPGQALPMRSAGGLAAQKRALASGATEVSDVTLGSARRTFVITIEVAVPKDGAPYRVLTVATSLDGFAALLNRQKMPEGWLVGIIDRQGKFVARAPRKADVAGQPASEGFRAHRGVEGVWEYAALEGDMLVSANGVAPKSGFTVGVAIAKNQMVAGGQRALWWTIGLASGVAAIGLMTAALLAQRIASAIAKLRRQSAALVQGHPLPAFRSRVPEIDETWSTLTSAVEARRSAEAERQRAIDDLVATNRALRDSDVRLRLALDAAKLGLWQYEIFSGTVKWDNQFAAIFEVNYFEAQLDVAMHRLVAEDMQRVKAALEASWSTTDPVPYNVQYRIKRSGGALRWIEAHGTTEFEGAGANRKAIRVVGTVADITEDKLHQEHTELLMHEVAHRSKNILSVVQSIARLTAKSNSADFAARFTERIQALAASQDVMVNGRWLSANIEDLVRSQLAHFEDVAGRRITLKGDAMHISPGAAQTLGMALHELATNASKYGALSNADGCVVVGWQVLNAPDGDRFIMSWRESGGPTVVAPTRRGFGSTVIETMAKGGLGADVSLSYAPEGLCWQLSCPLTRVMSEHDAGLAV